ncbi:MAG TPA: DUF6737 family protein [Stenomitos sp.]
MTEPTYNPWHHKPWWCQPWSIILTAITLTGGTWVVTHLWWLTVIVGIPLGLWMSFFVFLWPSLMRQALAQQSSEPLTPPN